MSGRTKADLRAELEGERKRADILLEENHQMHHRLRAAIGLANDVRIEHGPECQCRRCELALGVFGLTPRGQQKLVGAGQ